MIKKKKQQQQKQHEFVFIRRVVVSMVIKYASLAFRRIFWQHTQARKQYFYFLPSNTFLFLNLKLVEKAELNNQVEFFLFFLFCIYLCLLPEIRTYIVVLLLHISEL
jgi:hypothetical protein